MRIPTSIQIVDTTYTVRFQDDLQEVGNYLGAIRYQADEIVLQSVNKDVSENTIQQVFWHEIIHGILEKMGEKELAENEQFCDLFASILNQVVKTGDI